MTNPRLRAERGANFDDVTTMIQEILCAAWGEDWGTFTQSYPSGRDSTDVDLPMITYQLDGMRPGIIGNSNTREIKPRIREYVKTEDDEGGITIYGRVLDCSIRFECWADNNKKATELAMDFIDLLDTYTGFLLRNGVARIIFSEMTNPGGDYSLKDNAASRVLKYDVRIEHVTEARHGTIDRIIAEVTNALRQSAEQKESMKMTIEKSE